MVENFLELLQDTNPEIQESSQILRLKNMFIRKERKEGKKKGKKERREVGWGSEGGIIPRFIALKR